MDQSHIQHDEVDISMNKLKQALVDSTNIRRKNSHTSSRSVQGHRQRTPTIRRCKEITKRHDRLSTSQTKIDVELSKDEQFRIQQRAMYNARQTLFIPLITNMDFSLLLESSEQQNDLLTDILTLLNNSNEECSFFGQFSI